MEKYENTIYEMSATHHTTVGSSTVVLISSIITFSHLVMKTSRLLLGLLSLAGQVSATHLLGGYISAKSQTGSTLTYEVTVTLYYNQTGTISNANSIMLCFGDGTTQEATRISQVLSNDKLVSLNTYQVNHTYAGPGTYTLITSLANRTTAQNITTNAQEPITLTTTILTNTVSNRTPTLSIPSTSFEVSVNQRLVFPIKAIDEDGDSLVYTLTRPMTSMANTPCAPRMVSLYLYPNDLTRRGIYKLDNRTGNLTWDAPVEQGNYSVAITVCEYRKDVQISQTLIELSLVVVDRPGTPGVIPPYEPARESGLVTALPNYYDGDITLTLQPNPVENQLQVIIQTGNPATARMQLLDSKGRTLHDITFGRLARQHEQFINMDSLTPGLYVVRAHVGDRIVVRKVVKR